MALAPEVGHAGGHLPGRVVSKQRPLGQLHQGLCDLKCYYDQIQKFFFVRPINTYLPEI